MKSCVGCLSLRAQPIRVTAAGRNAGRRLIGTLIVEMLAGTQAVLVTPITYFMQTNYRKYDFDLSCRETNISEP